jgi:hypothetical protein
MVEPRRRRGGGHLRHARKSRKGCARFFSSVHCALALLSVTIDACLLAWASYMTVRRSYPRLPPRSRTDTCFATAEIVALFSPHVLSCPDSHHCMSSLVSSQSSSSISVSSLLDTKQQESLCQQAQDIHGYAHASCRSCVQNDPVCSTLATSPSLMYT